MHLDLEHLSLRGGERHEYVSPLDTSPVVLGGADYQILLPDGIRVVVDRVAGGFLVEVSAEARVYGPCARCLNEVALEVRAEQQEFAPTATGGWKESELSAFIDDLVVDVGGIAREAVILAIPSQVLCSPSCKGLCPHCGHELNRGSCGCAALEISRPIG
jgi:uncharacterized protein